MSVPTLTPGQRVKVTGNGTTTIEDTIVQVVWQTVWEGSANREGWAVVLSNHLWAWVENVVPLPSHS